MQTLVKTYSSLFFVLTIWSAKFRNYLNIQEIDEYLVKSINLYLLLERMCLGKLVWNKCVRPVLGYIYARYPRYILAILCLLLVL